MRPPYDEGAATVVFYKVDGGGHSLPSIEHPLKLGFILRRIVGPECHDAEAAVLAWQFFQSVAGR